MQDLHRQIRRPLPHLAAGCVVAVFVWSAATSARQSDKIDRLLGEMTLHEKISMLYGASDPERYGQAGYLPGVARLDIPPLRLTDGPGGIRTSQPATALPAPVALASTFSPELAREYGNVIGRDARARHQNVVLAPMVNIIRVPQGGRNFETLGEDPFLAGRMVAAEIEGIQSAGTIATVKHFALNNQENQRQSVSVDVDERTMHEVELPGFEAAVRAGVGAVMAAYNKVNGTWAAENPVLLTDVLRTAWHFDGFVMSDWGATHSGVAALSAGLDMEMPSGRNYAPLEESVARGELPLTVVDRAVRRILTAMDKAGLLTPTPTAASETIPEVTPAARDIAIEGAVLLRNRNDLLPLEPSDQRSLLVVGPTARTLLVGGGGSAHVQPMHGGSVLAMLREAVAGGTVTYEVGYDVDGVTVPASALASDSGSVGPIDFVGRSALAAGSSWRWSGTITAPETGQYAIKLQTAGGRGSLTIDPPAASTTPAANTGRAGRGGGRGGGGGTALLPTADGLGNPTGTIVEWQGGSSHTMVITADAGAATPMQVRLAWLTPHSADARIDEAVAAARRARTAIVFAYDESSEGRDRPSLSLPGTQDQLIHAIAAANPRTVVVLNNGAPILMPWVDEVGAILQMWYPGQEGAEATAAILTGRASPGGRLPVTFPKRAEDAPTATPERYPGVNGHGQYSEGIYVGYRWYDQQQIEPLFPFGHGLSYTTFAYSHLTVLPAGDGFDVTIRVSNTGRREGTEVPQLYVGPPSPAAVPMAVRALAGFTRVTLQPGASRDVTIHVGARELSYWSVTTHEWMLAIGRRPIMIGASSRDIRLRGELDVRSR